MQKSAGIIRVSLIMAMLLAVASCSALYRNHGYVPTDEDLSAITVGKDSKESVAQLVGQPTTSGLLDSSGWFYVESRFRHFAYQAPREIERTVLMISFDGRGVVTNIERFGLEDGRVIALSRRVTETTVTDTPMLRRLFGKLGQGAPAGLFGG